MKFIVKAQDTARRPPITLCVLCSENPRWCDEF